MLVYLIRTIKARWLENAAIIAVFAVIVATGTLIMSFAANIQRVAVSGGDPSTVVVLSRGSQYIGQSAVGKPGYDWVRARQEVEQRDGNTMVSPEMISQIRIRSNTGVQMFVAMRGVDPIAFQVHSAVHVIKGRMPEPGTDEILIGKTLDGIAPGFVVGGNWVGHPIVGVFESHGSLLEHEMWMGRQRLMVELGRAVREPIAFLFAKAKSPADAKTLADQINASKEQLSAFTEPAYLEAGSGASRRLTHLALAFSLLLAFGAGIASVNTLYSSVLGRLPEFAALHALGVRRLRLASLVLQESLLLSIIGIAIGIGITALLNGRNISSLWTDQPFERMPLTVGLPSVITGIAVGLGVGFAGGLLPAGSIFRVDMGKYR